MAELASEHSADWQGLGVSILHRLVMENLLRHKELPKPMYVHSAEEVAEALRKGDAVGRDATGQMGSGGRFELACLVMPATVDHVRQSASTANGCPPRAPTSIPSCSAGWSCICWNRSRLPGGTSRCDGSQRCSTLSLVHHSSFRVPPSSTWNERARFSVSEPARFT